MSNEIIPKIIKFYLVDIRDIDFSYDSRYIVGASSGGHVNVWDLKTGKKIWETFKHKEGAMAVAFSPHGKTIVSGGLDYKVMVWDVPSKKRLYKIKTGKSSSMKINFPNNIAFGKRNDQSAMIRVGAGLAQSRTTESRSP